MGAPKGNRNNRKGTDWVRALKAELHFYEDEARGIQKGNALQRIAKMCVEDALSADPDVRLAARQEIANRLDGKPKEFVEHEFTERLAEELTDEQLADIARGGGEGVADAQAREAVDPSVH